MELSEQRICITGGVCFIGSNLSDEFVEDNELIVIDRFGCG